MSVEAALGLVTGSAALIVATIFVILALVSDNENNRL